MTVEIALFSKGVEPGYPGYKRAPLSSTGWHIIGQSISRIEPVRFPTHQGEPAGSGFVLAGPRFVADAFGIYCESDLNGPKLLAFGRLSNIVIVNRVTPEVYPLTINLSELEVYQATALVRQLTRFKGPVRSDEEVLSGALRSLTHIAETQKADQC